MSPENASQDPSGRYVRDWCPELAKLATKYVHRPWTASEAVLAAAGVELGVTYPRRIVDLASERAAAKDSVLAMRRAHLSKNDANGYDLIHLPCGATTRVFTKQEFRLKADGSAAPPPPPRRAGGRGGKAKKQRSGK